MLSQQSPEDPLSSVGGRGGGAARLACGPACFFPLTKLGAFLGAGAQGTCAHKLLQGMCVCWAQVYKTIVRTSCSGACAFAGRRCTRQLCAQAAPERVRLLGAGAQSNCAHRLLGGVCICWAQVYKARDRTDHLWMEHWADLLSCISGVNGTGELTSGAGGTRRMG